MLRPTSKPSSDPSSEPSSQPSSQPTCEPSSQPSSEPSSQPSHQPSAGPSSQPTGAPTSQPSQTNVLLLNPLEQRWTRAFVLIKINAYLLAYALFFVTLFVILLALDKSGVLKWYSSALHASSFKSRVYMPRIVNVNRANKRGSDPALDNGAIDISTSAAASRGAAKAESCGALLLDSLLRGNIERREQYDELIREVGCAQGAHGSAGEHVSIDVSPGGAGGLLDGGDGSGRRSGQEMAAKQNKAFDAEFNDYLLLKRCYLGCSAVLFKGGLRIPVLGVALREGLAENFLLYLMNNHSIVSCVYACKQSSHSRNSRRWVLIVQHAVGFFITNLVGVLLITVGVGAVYSQATAQPAASYFACQLFDIFVTSPIALTFGEVFRRLYRCDVSVSTIEKYPRYVKALTAVRKWLVIPLIILGVFGLLVICAVLTTGQSREGNIVSYMRDVFLVTVVLDLVYAALNFVSTYHYAVYLFGGRLCVLSVGQLYVELLLLEGRGDGVDYKVSSYSHIGGLLRIDKIADTANDSSQRPSSAAAGLGLGSKPRSFVQVNPMHQSRPQRQPSVGGRVGRDHRASPLSAGDVGGDEDSFQITNPLREREAARRIRPVLPADIPQGLGVAPALDLEMAVMRPHSEAAAPGEGMGAAAAPTSEGEMQGEAAALAEDPGVQIRLNGRRASFVENLVFFENRFGGRGGRLYVEGRPKDNPLARRGRPVAEDEDSGL